VIKRRRNEAILPEKLEDLAMKTVFKNYSLFLHPESPFGCLRKNKIVFDNKSSQRLIYTFLFSFAANTMVQKFLSAIAVGVNRNRPVIPEEALQPFVLLLLNPNITQFKFNIFHFHKFIKKLDGEFVFNFLLENCPKVTAIDSSHCPTNETEEIPVLKLATSWPNLRSLSMIRFEISDNTMRLISIHLPKLE